MRSMVRRLSPAFIVMSASRESISARFFAASPEKITSRSPPLST